MTEFSIYTIGDADSYFFVFNAIASFIQSNYILFASSMAIMIMTIRSGLNFSKADPKSGVYSIILMITLYSSALFPTTTAHIIDVRQQGQNKTYTKIDNLPFALVFFASNISKVVIPIVELTEVAFSNVENNATLIGIGKQPELMNNFLKISNFLNQENTNYPLSFFKNAFKIYTKECAMSTSYIPDVGLDYFIKPTQDILDHISPTELSIPNSAFTNTTFSDGTVTIQKCNDLYKYLTDKRTSIQNLIEEKFKKINSDIDYEANKESIAQGLYEAGIRVNNIATTLGTYSENLKISMLNYALSQTLEETITDYKYDLPGVSGDLIDYSVNKSSFVMKTDGLGTWAWVNKVAPLVIHYSLIFSYALFLFVIPVAMGMGFENSKMMISKYFMGVLAIHVGYISSSVANSIAIYYMEKSANDLIFEMGNNLMAINSIPSFNANASEMAAISGILLLSSYTLGTGIILKGEVSAMQGVMNTIGGRFKNDMLNSAQDMANKNAYDEVSDIAKTDASRFLKNNGFTAPAGVDEVSYANQIKQGLEAMGSGYGFLNANKNSNFESDYIQGVANKSAAGASSMATMGSKVSMGDSINSGIATGNMEAGSIKGLSTALKEIGGDKLFDSSKTNTIQKTMDQVASADAISEKFGSDLNGNSNGLSYMELAKTENEAKLAGRIGGAKGYKNLGENAFDVTAGNAEYMTESKARSTQARINSLGGVDQAVATDVANAMLKAVSEKLDISAKKDAGILNTNNELTKSGLNAMAIKPGEDANAIMSKYAIGNNSSELLEKIAKEQNLTDAEAKEKFAPFMNSDGTFKSGQDFWNAIASQKAGVFSGHNSIMFGDGSMFSGGFDKNGALMGKFSSGISSIDDNSNTKTDLNSTTTGSRSDFFNDQINIQNTTAATKNQLENTNGNINATANRLITRDRLAYESDPRNQALDATTDMIHRITDDENNQENASLLAGGVGTAVGISLGTGLIEKATKDKNGNGIVKKGWNVAREKGGDLRDSIFGSSENEAYNKSNYTNHTETDGTTDNKTDHNDSLRKYSNAEAHNSSITQNITDGNSNNKSFLGKAGLLGFVAGTIHEVSMNGGNVGATMDAIGHEVGSTWQQFKSDVSNHGLFRATTNQIGDAFVGEQNRIAANTLFNSGNSMQGYAIAGAGIVDNAIGLGANILNMGASAAESLNSNISYSQAFSQNSQGWASGSNFANAISSSYTSAPAANAIMSVDNPLISNIEKGMSHDIQSAQVNKEANIELVDQLTQLTDAMKSISKSNNEGI